MQHQLPKLPYPKNGLEPYISTETIDYHYGKHHASYVEKLNGLTPGTEFEDSTLEDIILNAAGGIFNNGAQIWNHTFYWQCLHPDGGGTPTGNLADELNDTFDGLEKLKKTFTGKATNNFGSGWTWLVRNDDQMLQVVNTDDADNPLTHNMQPLLTCDVWEHAYYLDHRNARDKYLDAFWKMVNWEFVAQNHAVSIAEMKRGHA